jgi:hypothetical protein
MDTTIAGVALALAGVLLLGWVVYRQSVEGVMARAVPVAFTCASCQGALWPGQAMNSCTGGHRLHRRCVTQGAHCPVPGCPGQVA